MKLFRRWLIDLVSARSGLRTDLCRQRARRTSAHTRRRSSAFQDGMWSRAEMEFDQFNKIYPNSTNAPQAVLLQAQAEFKQGELTNAMALLWPTPATWRRPAPWPINMSTGPARRSFKMRIIPMRRKHGSNLNKNFTNHRCGCACRRRTRRLRLCKMATGNRRLTCLRKQTACFQARGAMDSANELVSRGRLLLAQAKFALKDLDGEFAVLTSLNSQTLKPDLDWQRAHIFFTRTGTRRVISARRWRLRPTCSRSRGWKQKRPAWTESVAMHAEALEKSGRTDEAIAAYQENLTNSASVDSSGRRF
jgi:tetratricopeptide (TPR) repeat protein